MDKEKEQVVVETEEHALVPCAAEPADELTLLRQIRDNLEEQNKQGKKQIRLLRTCLLAVVLLALVAVIGAAALVPSLYQMTDNINKTINALDMEQIDEIIGEVQTVAKASSGVVAGMSDALTKINALDFTALNDTIVSLKKTVEDFAQLDIVSLNEAIKNLNETVEPFARFFSKFN